MKKAFLINYVTALCSLATVFALAALLSGCGVFTAIDGADPALKAAFLKVTARTATFEGLKQGYDDDEAAERRATAVLIYLTVGTVQDMMAADTDGIQVGDFREIVGLWSFDQIDVPPEVKFALSDVMDIMLSTIRPASLEELLTEDELLYLNAFLDGIRDGAFPFTGEPSD